MPDFFLFDPLAPAHTPRLPALPDVYNLKHPVGHGNITHLNNVNTHNSLNSVHMGAHMGAHMGHMGYLSTDSNGSTPQTSSDECHSPASPMSPVPVMADYARLHHPHGLVPTPNPPPQPVQQQQPLAPPAPVVTAPAAVTTPSLRTKGRKRPRSPSSAAAPAEAIPEVPVDSTTLSHLLQEQDLKKKRLARKALLARKSRQRKKMRLTELETENSELRAEIDRLRKLRKHDQETIFAQRKTLEVSAPAVAVATPAVQGNPLDDSLSKLASFDPKHYQAQGMASPATLVDDFLATLKCTGEAAEFHLSSLQNHVNPPLLMKFLRWLMNRPEDFYCNKDSLWFSLFEKDLGLQPDAMQHMLALKQELKQIVKPQCPLTALYTQFQEKLRHENSLNHDAMQRMGQVLEPNQLVAFLQWISKYGEVCLKI